MNFSYCYSLILFFILNSHASWLTGSRKYRIKNFSMVQCNSVPQPLLFDNVTVSTSNDGDLLVFGTMSSTVNLESPITISIDMKRKTFGMWIKVYCIHGMGSCTYQDACSFGFPNNQTCPAKFQKDKIPCRCPIEKGNYTIPPDVTIPKEFVNLDIAISGKYRGKVNIAHKTTQLACYDTKFTLY